MNSNEKELEIEKLKKELKFANSQLTKTLKMYDNAKKEMEKAVAARSEFLSKLSHEARTPMNALIGYAELINQEDINGEFYEFSMGIKSATNRLLNFFNDLIEISRIESGVSTLIEDEYKVEDSIKYVLNNVLYDVESKGLELRFKIGENIPSVMYGDKIHIQQIVLNLLSNAIKFTEKGYIEVEINAGYTDMVSKNGRKLVKISISVADSGKGIRKEDREKLYVAFSQFNSKSVYENQGAGLGLTISKYFSNLMNGDITFESRYGKGSKFTCTILQEVVDETPLDRKKVSKNVYSNEIELSAPKAKVLLVDDSVVNLNIGRGLLLWFDINAATAGGGYEAIEMAKKNNYDIIFMDHMMPDIDGIEATKQIRKLNEHNRKVPIVALTANTTDEARTVFISNGFNDFLAKPVELDAFKIVLERWLPKSKIIRGSKSKTTQKIEAAYESINQEEFLEHGIYVSKGLVYFAGKISAYIDTLKVLYKEGREKIVELRKYYEEQDLKNYAIIAHSIKSATASIGAVEISELAKENELEAKEKNWAYIQEKGPVFIEEYDKLLEFIEDKVGKDEEEQENEGNIVSCDSAVLLKKIDAAIDDIEDFESDMAVEKLKELKNLIKNVDN